MEITKLLFNIAIEQKVGYTDPVRMKYFICALDKIDCTPASNQQAWLAIPAERTERIISSGRIQTAVYETENRESETGSVYISLPAMFRLKDRVAPHGLVLKGSAPPETVLLTPRIQNELEIPEENIKALPKVIDEMYVYFRGVFFQGEKMILILDPEKLTEGLG